MLAVFLWLGRAIQWRLIGSFVLLSLPLLLVSYLIHKHFVFYDASGPNALYVGNLVGYSGKGFYGLEDKGVQTLIAHYGPTYVGFLKYLKTMLTEVPVEFLKMYGRKIYFLCSNYEIPSNYNYYLFSQFAPVLKMPHSQFAVFLTAGIFGLALATWRNLKIWPLYIFFFGFCAAALPFQNEARFRLPWLPVLMLFSFYFFWEIFLLVRRNYFSLALGAAVLVWCGVFSLRNPIAEEMRVRADDYAVLAMLYAEKNDLQNLKRAETASGLCWNALVREGRPVEEVREGLEKIYRKMVKNLIEEKNNQEIATILQKIIVLSPENQEAKGLLDMLGSAQSSKPLPTLKVAPWFPFEMAAW